MKKKLLSLALALTLCLGLSAPAAAAEDDSWAGAKPVATYAEFKAALGDDTVEKIKVTGAVEVTEDLETAKPILIGNGAHLTMAAGKTLASTAPMGMFNYEDKENMWTQMRQDFAGFLLWVDGENCYRKCYGTLSDAAAEVYAKGHGALNTLSLGGALTLDKDLSCAMILMNGLLTLKDGVTVTVSNCYPDGSLVLGKKAKLAVSGEIGSSHDISLGEGAVMETNTFYADGKLELGKDAKLTVADPDFYVGGNTVLGEGASVEAVFVGLQADLTMGEGAAISASDVDEFGTGVYVKGSVALGKDAKITSVRLYSEGSITLDAGASVESKDSFVEGKITLNNGAVQPENLHAGEESGAAFPFTDVPDVFKESVAWAVEKGITNGYDATTFGSSNDCTHNHILTFIWRANGSPAAEGEGDFAKAVSWAKTAGIAPQDVNGADKCTRAQAMTYLWKLAKSPETAANDSFTDVSASADYAQAVAWAVANGITNGTGDGTTFSPDQVCNRGQIVTFLCRNLNK